MSLNGDFVKTESHGGSEGQCVLACLCGSGRYFTVHQLPRCWQPGVLTGAPRAAWAQHNENKKKKEASHSENELADRGHSTSGKVEKKGTLVEAFSSAPNTLFSFFLASLKSRPFSASLSPIATRTPWAGVFLPLPAPTWPASPKAGP